MCVSMAQGHYAHVRGPAVASCGVCAFFCGAQAPSGSTLDKHGTTVVALDQAQIGHYLGPRWPPILVPTRVFSPQQLCYDSLK